MELRNYLSILARRKWVILLTVIVTFVVVVIGTFLTPPKYRATATLRVGTAAERQGMDWRFDIQYADRLMNTLVKLVTSEAIIEELRQKLEIEKAPDVKADIVVNTELILLAVEDQDPGLAQRAANLWAEIFIARYKKSVRTVTGQPTISVVVPAEMPDTPSSPRIALNLALGLLLGLMGGLGLGFVFENLDTTVYSIEQIEKASEQTVLGEIPSAKRNQSQPIFDQDSPQGDAFRRLRINLSTLDHGAAVRSILVTSPTPGDGKTTIASNLAYAVAQSKDRVLLVDCELQSPILHQRFDLPNDLGLCNVLKQEVSLVQAVQQSKIPGLWVLTSGPIPPNPSELINSPQMTLLIKQAMESYDLILLDTPALLAVKHSAALASAVDSVVLVVTRGHTQGSSIKASCQLLRNAKARSVGVIVNRAELGGQYLQQNRRQPSIEERKSEIDSEMGIDRERLIYKETLKPSAKSVLPNNLSLSPATRPDRKPQVPVNRRAMLIAVILTGVAVLGLSAYYYRSSSVESPPPIASAILAPTAVLMTMATPTISVGCLGGCAEPPPGCVIKGNVTTGTGEKIYHLPGGKFYDLTIISPSRGERWFCTEEEARASGWRKSNQ